MAMNKYMHPRNIYKTPPDFKKLAINFPEFRKFVQQDITGKISFDFKNVEALRALFCTLMKKDFDLDVEIPLHKLIPTVPLRLNYILWLEDLLNIADRQEGIKGIDIGAGASCVYPLLAAKKNKWTMIATETDTHSITYAVANVKRNNLDDLIKVVQVDEQTILTEVVKDDRFDFCMCNPPFFGCVEDLNPNSKSRNPSRPRPKNSFCATTNEVIVHGGEVAFIKKLIEESKLLQTKVKIYSTMVGHKRNLPQLKSLLREVAVASFKEANFCQGNITRWGLAWTFSHDFDLKKCLDPAKQLSPNKKKKPLCYKIPVENADESFLEKIREDLLQLFKNLNMIITEKTRNMKYRRYHMKASSNTWSNQRRKKREQIRKEKEPMESMDSSEEMQNEDSSLEESNHSDEGVKSPGKRTNEDSFDGLLMKKLKLSDSKGTSFFEFTFSLIFEEGSIYLELDCIEDYDNKDYLHQILQYIKNNLKINE